MINERYLASFMKLSKFLERSSTQTADLPEIERSSIWTKERVGQKNECGFAN